MGGSTRREFLVRTATAMALVSTTVPGMAQPAAAPAPKRKLKKAVVVSMIGVKGTLTDKFKALKAAGFAGVQMDSPLPAEMPMNAVLAITWSFAIYHVGRATPFHVAMRSHRSMDWAGRVVAIVGLVVCLPFFLLIYRFEQSIWTVPIIASVPLWLLVGVRHSPPGAMRVGFDRPAKLALLASVLVILAMVPGAMNSVEYRFDLPGANGAIDIASLQVAGRVLPAGSDERDWVGASSGLARPLVRAQPLASHRGYAQIHAEIWPAVANLTALDARAREPLAVVALQRADQVLVPSTWSLQLMGATFFGGAEPAGDADELAGYLDSTMYRAWGPTLVLLIGTSANGTRDVLTYSQISSDIAFQGSVVEWLAAR